MTLASLLNEHLLPLKLRVFLYRKELNMGDYKSCVGCCNSVVIPSDLRRLEKGPYEGAFVKHKARGSMEVERWEEALGKAADIQGHPFHTGQGIQTSITVVTKQMLVKDLAKKNIVPLPENGGNGTAMTMLLQHSTQLFQAPLRFSICRSENHNVNRSTINRDLNF